MYCAGGKIELGSIELYLVHDIPQTAFVAIGALLFPKMTKADKSFVIPKHIMDRGLYATKSMRWLSCAVTDVNAARRAMIYRTNTPQTAFF